MSPAGIRIAYPACSVAGVANCICFRIDTCQSGIVTMRFERTGKLCSANRLPLSSDGDRSKAVTVADDASPVVFGRVDLLYKFEFFSLEIYFVISFPDNIWIVWLVCARVEVNGVIFGM